jgi:hypothetical protein
VFFLVKTVNKMFMFDYFKAIFDVLNQKMAILRDQNDQYPKSRQRIRIELKDVSLESSCNKGHQPNFFVFFPAINIRYEHQL